MGCRKYRTLGKIKPHAIDRLIGQYGFKGNRGKAKKFLKKCLDLLCDRSDKNCKKEIPTEMLRQVGIEGRRLFIEISFGIIENVKEIRA